MPFLSSVTQGGRKGFFLQLCQFIPFFAVLDCVAKFGKLRPYLLFSPFLIMISTAALFYVPDFGYAGKVAYAAVTYILWGICFTIQDLVSKNSNKSESTYASKMKTALKEYEKIVEENTAATTPNGVELLPSDDLSSIDPSDSVYVSINTRANGETLASGDITYSTTDGVTTTHTAKGGTTAEYIGIHGLSQTVDDKVGRIMVSKNPLDIIKKTCYTNYAKLKQFIILDNFTTSYKKLQSCVGKCLPEGQHH